MRCVKELSYCITCLQSKSRMVCALPYPLLVLLGKTLICPRFTQKIQWDFDSIFVVVDMFNKMTFYTLPQNT